MTAQNSGYSQLSSFEGLGKNSQVREGHEEMDYRDHDSAGKGERVDKTTAMQNAKGALEEDERQSGRRTKHRTSEARAQVSS
jgi:hypothetical protein